MWHERGYMKTIKALIIYLINNDYIYDEVCMGPFLLFFFLILCVHIARYCVTKWPALNNCINISKTVRCLINEMN